MSFAPEPSLYDGTVTHIRAGAIQHRLSYRVTSLLLPLHKLDEANGMSRLFSVNKGNIFSFHESDHMDEEFDSLAEFLTTCLRRSGMFSSDEVIPDRFTLLAFPRFLGHAFNPLTIIYCCDDADQVRAILYQVRNTFGQRHHYLYRLTQSEATAAKDQKLCHGGEKQFYVSPFLDMDGHYEFSVRLPDDALSCRITMSGNQPSSLTAHLVAQRLPLSTATLARMIGSRWQSGLKILAAIHFEAAKLWLKGAPFHRRPPLPKASVTNLAPPSLEKGTQS